MWGDLESRVGERVTLAGTAQNAAAGAIVSLEGRPVYVSDLPAWPPDLAGRAVEVTGTLVFRPAPSPEGPTVHRLSASYELHDAVWSATG